MNRWLKVLGIAVAVTIALVAAGKIVVAVRDQTDPVDPGAVAADVDGQGASDPGATALNTGVWAHDASGEEFIDLLGGPLHEFPPEVAQTVAGTTCGQSIDVRLFEQRYDIFDLCRDDDDRLVFDTFTSHHEFVGIVDESVTDGCDPLAVWWPGTEANAGNGATTSCTSTSSGSVSTRPPSSGGRSMPRRRPTRLSAISAMRSSSTCGPDPSIRSLERVPHSVVRWHVSTASVEGQGSPSADMTFPPIRLEPSSAPAGIWHYARPNGLREDRP